jgi:nucleotide-binding universal stress UspA family protein
MFKHIVVPLDGSALAESVLPSASVLSSYLVSKVTLLHLIEQNAPEEIHKDRHLTKPEEAGKYLQEIAEKYFAGAKVDWHVHLAEVKDVAESLASHAVELSADLIVMCAHGQGGLRNILFGSIAQRVIALGKTPVLLLRPDSSPSPQGFTLDKILLPLDSESSHDDVFPVATQLAQAFTSEIAMLTVIPTFGTLTGEEAAPSSLLPGTTIALLDIEEEVARQHLHVHLDELHALGLAASAAVLRGDPAKEIVNTAEKWNPDLILLATHRKAGMDAFWAASVAPDVARKTKIPLLLLPLK